jgi:hypothetical protein
LKKLIRFGKALAPGLKAAAGIVWEEGITSSNNMTTKKSKKDKMIL